jgi:hypothetical protein
MGWQDLCDLFGGYTGSYHSIRRLRHFLGCGSVGSTFSTLSSVRIWSSLLAHGSKRGLNLLSKYSYSDSSSGSNNANQSRFALKWIRMVIMHPRNAQIEPSVIGTSGIQMARHGEGGRCSQYVDIYTFVEEEQNKNKRGVQYCMRPFIFVWQIKSISVRARGGVLENKIPQTGTASLQALKGEHILRKSRDADLRMLSGLLFEN